MYWCQHDVWDLEWDPDLGLWFWEESGRELQGPTQHYMDAEGNYRHWMEGLYIDKTLRALWPTASQAPATVSMTAP